MTFFSRMAILVLIFLSMNNAYAVDRGSHFYRNFEQPTYHGLRLNYCTLDGKECGMPVATRYCQMMGYPYAKQQVIDYNIGLTNFMSATARCTGWQCNGFKTIRCVASLSHSPPKPYHYRLRQFVFPRYGQYRVAWCYDDKKGCGKRAAFSFCRRMGYLKTHRYAIERRVAATKAIGNQKLCFGKECNAFDYIICYR